MTSIYQIRLDLFFLVPVLCFNISVNIFITDMFHISQICSFLLGDAFVYIGIRFSTSLPVICIIVYFFYAMLARFVISKSACLFNLNVKIHVI